MVPLERIRPYDRNPRHERNEAYDRIKQSISSRGFTGSLPITRRPGDRDYMIAEGGNTVLQILKELYTEIGDPRFHTVQCLFEPWVSESATLIAYLRILWMVIQRWLAQGQLDVLPPPETKHQI